MTVQREKSIICNKPRLTVLHAGIVLTPPLEHWSDWTGIAELEVDSC
jgi:hypothetical protein